MPLTMYDNITVSLIPANAEAVAGYVDGKWATWGEIQHRFPKAHKLSIAVSAGADADCLDVEAGDATNAQAPPWVKRQLARGVKRPVLYTSLSNAPQLIATLSQAGIRRQDIRLWTAHYTGRPHFCNAGCGYGFKFIADATQYDDHALGRSLDVSLVNDTFFGVPPNRRHQIWHSHLIQTNRALVALQAKAALLRRLLSRK